MSQRSHCKDKWARDAKRNSQIHSAMNLELNSSKMFKNIKIKKEKIKSINDLPHTAKSKLNKIDEHCTTIDKLLPKDLSLKLLQDIRLLENKRKYEEIKNRAKSENNTTKNPPTTKEENALEAFNDEEVKEFYAIKDQEQVMEKYDIRIVTYFKTLYLNSFHFNLRKTYVMSIKNSGYK